MKQYVLGFLFDKQLTLVGLICKQRPEWQRGKLNGIGGKIEAGETPVQAMQREFCEETGIEINDWRNFATMRGNDWTVHVFCASDDDVLKIQSVTDESVTFRTALAYNHGCTHNVNWLIAMARAHIAENLNLNYEVFEKEIA